MPKFVRLSIAQMEAEIRTKLEKYREHAYIGCFSETSNSLLMWSHYADSGKGICIEYCLQNIDTSYLFPVYYSNERQKFSYLTSGIPIRNLVKAKDWDYEQEWRIVYYQIDLTKAKNHLKIPIPTKILLGPRFEENEKEMIIELKAIAAAFKIPIVETALHSSEYKIV